MGDAGSDPASAGLVFLAFAQTWWVGHIIFSDGISYLDIATNYALGDWHKALNEYWSPLLYLKIGP